MNSIHDISTTSLWWSDPWWEDPSYHNDTRLTLAEVRARIAVLRRFFTAEWMQRGYQAETPNAVIPLLSRGTGLWPFQHLMWLGGIFCPLADVPTLRRPLDDLIGPKSRATLFELETASWFANRHWEIESDGPGLAPILWTGLVDWLGRIQPFMPMVQAPSSFEKICCGNFWPAKGSQSVGPYSARSAYCHPDLAPVLITHRFG
jgi:hypothetical protein